MGSEGGDALIAPVLCISEGLFGPVFVWEESEYRDRTSPYFQGGYWPPEAPAIQFKAMTLKPAAVRRYFDPATRIPLFEAAFHDSLVIANHWGADPFKSAGMERRSELFQLLYLASPVYNLNRDRLAEKGARMVQRTVFEGGLELIANFSDRSFAYEGRMIDAGGLEAILPDGTMKVYCPRPSETTLRAPECSTLW